MSFSAFVQSIRALVPVACIILLFPLGAAAQQVGGGVKVGLALSDVPNVDQLISDLGDIAGVTTSTRTGFAGGGFIMVRWKNGFAIQPEFLYTQKGVKLTVVEGSDSGQARLKTDFIDVPVLARYTVGKGVRGYVFGGPSFDFKVSAKIKVAVLGASEEQDVSSDVKSFEFALVVGGGVEFGPVLLEARWSEGLTNLDKKETSGGTSVKTRTYLFLAGLRF
jgi:hypothetical protein